MYREIRPTDNPDKGSHGGSCNRRACMRPKSALWFNSATKSYYCVDCAEMINEANYSCTAPEVLCIYEPLEENKL